VILLPLALHFVGSHLLLGLAGVAARTVAKISVNSKTNFLTIPFPSDSPFFRFFFIFQNRFLWFQIFVRPEKSKKCFSF
jgi:hypothetical protein